jgi:hypothetical protein
MPVTIGCTSPGSPASCSARTAEPVSVCCARHISSTHGGMSMTGAPLRCHPLNTQRDTQVHDR